MTYVITRLCLRDGTCVEVCPVGCIVPGARDASSWPLFYIDPMRCINCNACEVVCPIGAILPDYDVPDEYLPDVDENARFFHEGPGYRDFDLEAERTRFQA